MKPITLRIWLYNIIALLVLLLGVTIFVSTLQLGNLKGLAFRLYVLYGCFLLSTINVFFALHYMVNRQNAPVAIQIVISGIVVASLGVILGVIL